MRTLSKVEIARRQLGTALSLYLADRDPVSIHSLACAGCEIAETLAEKAGGPPFRTFTLAANPSMTDATFESIRNKYWNAFKHSTTRKGVERDDGHLLQDFTERENEERLFIGWSDYSIAGQPMPAEAQVYVTWFLALDFSKFA